MLQAASAARARRRDGAWRPGGADDPRRCHRGHDVHVVYKDNRALYIGARNPQPRHVPIQAPMGRRDGIESRPSTCWFRSIPSRSPDGLRLWRDRHRRTHRPLPSPGRRSRLRRRLQSRRARTYIEDDTEDRGAVDSIFQLRFNVQEEQVWGLNLQRFAPSRNEMETVPGARTVEGSASRFGDLVGIEGLGSRSASRCCPTSEERPRRTATAISATRSTRRRAEPGGSRPQGGRRPQPHPRRHVQPRLRADRSRSVRGEPHRERDLLRGAAAVLHRGRAPAEHAEATNFFYSRRIGAPPKTFVDYPREARIMGAAKLTGRLRSRDVASGCCAAVTDRGLPGPRRRSTGSGSLPAPPMAWCACSRSSAPDGGGDGKRGAPGPEGRRSATPHCWRATRSPAPPLVLRFRQGQYQVRSFAASTVVKAGMAEIKVVRTLLPAPRSNVLARSDAPLADTRRASRSSAPAAALWTAT